LYSIDLKTIDNVNKSELLLIPA